MGEVVNRRVCALVGACGIGKDRERLARRKKGRENMAKTVGFKISKNEASPIDLPGLCATVISEQPDKLSPVNETKITSS